MKLQRYVYCVKPGSNGCVNDEDAISADAGWMHWCPGCKTIHSIAVEKAFENGAQWTFNGDQVKPTFNPSIRVGAKCHYHLHDGIIKYCGDSTHKFSGQNVPLPDIPEEER